MDSVFVLNCGSSSIKFQLIAVESETIRLKGIIENLNTDRATLKWNQKEKKLGKCNSLGALDEITKLLRNEKIIAVGHRVVHGGEAFTKSIKVDETVLNKIKELSHLAPLHNPVNALGIEIMQEKFPELPQVAVFDTAFHQTLPEKAYLYAIPYEYYEKHQVRRYGFHGTSHRYVVKEGAKMIGKPLKETSFISCHLGNGCSITAVEKGKSIDTSMGLTPLEGLVMGERSGDLDPSIVGFLADHLKIRSIAKNHGVHLSEDIELIDPSPLREKFLQPLIELRKHKGLTEQNAKEALQENIVVGTMMLASGEVDGLVAGVIHTTAHTIRPALMLIKTKPDVKKVSSIFFMCLPKQVLVYGDCAVNQNPTAEELADIAIQCADSADRFGISPRVAMISYSTGTSGTGEDVTKVTQATELVKKIRPDILIDGPLQYDAAFTPDVAAKKAPNSPIAGKATVYVFPDLNTANTTYKAVQRSADVLSIGPMLQGLKKPVNDLSRGALVDDIVYTIAITAIQAE